VKILVADGRSEADFLIASLLRKKHRLTVVNSDRDYCKYLAATHDIPVINGDASKQYILDEAGIDGFDLVVALSPDDATNLVICQTAKRLYGVHKAVAIVSNPNSVEIFKELGINSAISSAHLVASSIEQASNIEKLSNSLSMAQGMVEVMEIVIGETSPVCGKKLTDLDFAADLNISCIVRGTEFLIPRGGTEINVGDRLVVVTTAAKKTRVFELLTGEKREA